MVVEAYFPYKGDIRDYDYEVNKVVYEERDLTLVNSYSITLYVKVSITSKRSFTFKYQPSSNEFLETEEKWGNRSRDVFIDISDIDNILEKLDSEDKVFSEMLYKICRQKLKEKLNDKKSVF